MSDLKGKNIIVTGASGGIGNSIIKKLYQNEANILASGTRLEKLDELKDKFENIKTLKFDISQSDKIDECVENATNELDGNFVDVATREGFKIAHDISVFSFTALAQKAKHLLKDRNSALLTLSYLGAQRTLPNYNVMGVAKAALESTTRYLANSLGSEQIRVNAISAGPVKTLAASGVKLSLIHI